MEFNVKDKVACQVETRKNGSKAIFSRNLVSENDKPTLENREFEVIALEPAFPGSTYDMYTIVVDDDMVGWTISEFHIRYQKVNPKFKGKKFWNITSSFMRPITTIVPVKIIESSILITDEVIQSSEPVLEAQTIQ